MVEGRRKSRSLRRLKTRIPTKTVVHYVKRKPSKAQCGSCGAILNGIPRLSATKFRNLSKSRKRPSRPFGGVLCSKCMRQAIVNKFRALLMEKQE